MDTLVTQSEDTAWGATVIAGTRVPVDSLFEYLKAGRSLDDFLEQFPTVDRKVAIAILSSPRLGSSPRRLPGEGAARRDASDRRP